MLLFKFISEVESASCSEAYNEIFAKCNYSATAHHFKNVEEKYITMYVNLSVV